MMTWECVGILLVVVVVSVFGFCAWPPACDNMADEIKESRLELLSIQDRRLLARLEGSWLLELR